MTGNTLSEDAPPEYTLPGNVPYNPAEKQARREAEIASQRSTFPASSSSSSQSQFRIAETDDQPEPGHIYIITNKNTSTALTNHEGQITLTPFDTSKNPQMSQRWVCHRSKGWLGFANDAGHSTGYLGHDGYGNIRCEAPYHRDWEFFTVTKRIGKAGFDIRIKDEEGLVPLCKSADGKNISVKSYQPNTWWRFTKISTL